MHGGGPYVVKAAARRLNGGGPFMVVVKNIPEWKNCSSWKKLHRRGKFYQWTKFRSVDNMSHCGKCVTHG